MLFLHRNENKGDGRFYLSGEMTAQAPASLDNPLIAELWRNFTYGTSSLTIQKCTASAFQIGTVKPLTHGGDGYAIRVNGDGISVAANDEKNLVRGLLTLLDMVLMDEDGRVYLSYTELHETPRIAIRIVHYCIFPDTELWEIRRFIRLCGVLKYTHIALEFWGMYRFSCLPELSWKHGYTKEQIAPLIAEAQMLGVEVIPMFNHWGHASGSRWMHGKHVVLDQAPSLQYLFEDGGWCWNYKSTRVRALMREIREELMELCGEGAYFLIGCDEAYGFSFDEDEIASVTQYLNEVAAELKQKGRRAIMWADMLLMANWEKNISALAPTKKNKQRCNLACRMTSCSVTGSMTQHIRRWKRHSPLPKQGLTPFSAHGTDLRAIKTLVFRRRQSITSQASCTPHGTRCQAECPMWDDLPLPVGCLTVKCPCPPP